mmetsp:Transcript_54867/g.146758  ORF Transcript_54867/g.146758 Transcript_54867/m.146758 type:complete len:270 (-) Transcript_54867:359-1168(-)
MFSTFTPLTFSRPAMSISLSKCPMLPTIALFFIFAMSVAMMMSLFPVVVTKMSASPITSSNVATWKPSMHACRAQIGSTSVIITRAPAPRMAKALPLPTSPYPQTTTRLPPIITSVARMMPSGRECLHPYTLSNFDFVTQSFTLIAGKSSSPFSAIWMRRCTPVVVSSDTPRTVFAMRLHFVGSFWIDSRSTDSTHLNSAFSVSAGSGSVPSFANASSRLFPSWINNVASPPSSTIMSGPSLPGQVSACSVHHQYSSRVSPFHAKTDAV